MLLKKFNALALIGASLALAGCQKASDPEAESQIEALETVITLAPGQEHYITRQLNRFNLTHYQPDGPDWAIALTTASGYKEIHHDPSVGEVHLNIDFDTLGEDKEITLAFLLELDPHKLDMDDNSRYRKYINNLRAMSRLMDEQEGPAARAIAKDAYLEQVKKYLRDTHGFTDERIEMIRRIGEGILERAEKGQVRVDPIAPDPM